MKKVFYFPVFTALFFSLTMFVCCLQAQNIELEKIRESCKGIAFDQRVRITVARFSVTSQAAQGKFGEELATMLTNALQNTSCFRVLETTKNMGDMTDEISLGQEGYTNGNSPQIGKMLGAQAVVTAEITEYNEGQTGVKALGFNVGSNKASIGFVLKVINPETREVLFSESIDVTSKKPGGFSGVKLFGLEVAGGSMKNKAVADAAEQAIIRAVEVMVKRRNEIPLPEANSGAAQAKVWNDNNCTLLQGGRAPKVMVIIPEVHVTSKIPDPAGETEIIRKFTEAGFQVIDPTIYAAIRSSDRVKAAEENPAQAAGLGKEFGADIIIIGEAFSQLANRENNMVACRARVEARAVRTDNAVILAANGMQAGGVDITESASAKTSLKNGGALLADYFLEQMCTKSITFSGSGAGKSGATTPKGTTEVSKTTEIKLTNVTFAKMKAIEDLLKTNTKVKGIEKSMSLPNATLIVQHTNSTDDIVDFLFSKAAAQLEITGVEPGKISAAMK